MPRSENPADLLTEFTDRPGIDKVVALLSVDCEDGRANPVPMLTHMVNYALAKQNDGDFPYWRVHGWLLCCGFLGGGRWR